MQIHRIPFNRVPALSHKDVFYQLEYSQLNNFYAFTPDLPGLEKAIGARKSFPVDRALLVDAFRKQYQLAGATPSQQAAIDSLADENTFTVVTAHQPSVLGGPAYYFYKIFSAINLVRQLQKNFPDCQFVPVFINGSEDHDFDEVRSVQLFGKQVDWQTIQSGPVGRFRTDGLSDVIRETADILGTSVNAKALVDLWTEALQAADTYNDFVFHWLNRLLGNYGVLVLSMDDAALKNAFLPVMKKEISERKSEMLVKETQQSLAAFHFKPQAFAREINLFYMEGNRRERITFHEGVYSILNTEMTFTQNEMESMLETHPERFSPNVILRPLFQETILPNIAYIGGGGELAYWLERKKQFAYFEVFFPTLIRRNSVLMIPPGQQKTLTKLQIAIDDVFQEEDKLVSAYLDQISLGEVHLDAEKELSTILFEKMALKAKAIDPTLEAFTLSEGHKVLKAIETLEARLKRSLKQKEETSLTQLKALKQKLFPGDGLQERKDSSMQFWVNSDAQWQEEIISLLNPLEKEFLVISL